jgi:hypothetical protein
MPQFNNLNRGRVLCRVIKGRACVTLRHKSVANSRQYAGVHININCPLARDGYIPPSRVSFPFSLCSFFALCSFKIPHEAHSLHEEDLNSKPTSFLSNIWSEDQMLHE